MKPGLAVLPLEVWADIFVFPWITREQLARIVHKFKNRNFTEKLQFRLHDMGKHTLRYLTIEEVKENVFAFLKTFLILCIFSDLLPCFSDCLFSSLPRKRHARVGVTCGEMSSPPNPNA